MKLINPIRGDKGILNTQANYASGENCHCMCSNGWDVTLQSSDASGVCACQCSYGSENQNANYTNAWMYIPPN